jgi:hypothetical protein
MVPKGQCTFIGPSCFDPAPTLSYDDHDAVQIAIRSAICAQNSILTPNCSISLGRETVIQQATGFLELL